MNKDGAVFHFTKVFLRNNFGGRKQSQVQARRKDDVSDHEFPRLLELLLEHCVPHDLCATAELAEKFLQPSNAAND